MTRPISRRELLKLGLATSIAPAARWLPVDVPSFTFTYFSDTHLALERNYEECRPLMLEMARVISPELAINGGDVTDYGWAGAGHLLSSPAMVSGSVYATSYSDVVISFAIR
jgi:hypothetical protein